jgi:hypothetical protein
MKNVRRLTSALLQMAVSSVKGKGVIVINDWET